MCFYPVCIILRPAAALSAAARARLGPGSGSGCSASISGLADPTAGRGSCVWAEAEFINNPRPPLWGGGAFLSEDVNHPPLPPGSSGSAPPVPLRGPPRGGSERGEGGALGSLAALLGLTSARSESPGAAAAKRLWLRRWALVCTRPRLGRRRQNWPRARLGSRLQIAPSISSRSDHAHISCFPNLGKKKKIGVVEPNIEYWKLLILSFCFLDFGEK